jgi:glycogen debranching enzyme
MHTQLQSTALNTLHAFSHQCLIDLSDEQGIAASAKTEAYGCLFGRDSAITILKILKVCEEQPDPELLAICKRTLLTHIQLQGKTYNIESGEEPGKFIHEFRTTNYERLVNRPRPWFVYPDGVLRNYDSVDATPLLLLAYHRYWKITGDTEFLLHVLNHVEAGLKWLITDADKDKDFLIEYELPEARQAGGLVVQSWTDSHACLTQKDGSFPLYPIAAVEVQACSWLALKTWAHFFRTDDKRVQFSGQLEDFAHSMKNQFAVTFIIKDQGLSYAAQAVDGRKRQVPTITANPLLCLWASFKEDGHTESIIDSSIIPEFVQRAFKDDMFHPAGGIRTMSTLSPLFDPKETSYHNGSFWPMLNGLIHEGLVNWGYIAEAEALRTASLLAIQHFQSPIELYCLTDAGEYIEYQSSWGKKGCRQQAWTAAAVLDLVAYAHHSLIIPSELVSPISTS